MSIALLKSLFTHSADGRDPPKVLGGRGRRPQTSRTGSYKTFGDMIGGQDDLAENGSPRHSIDGHGSTVYINHDSSDREQDGQTGLGPLGHVEGVPDAHTPLLRHGSYEHAGGAVPAPTSPRLTPTPLAATGRSQSQPSTPTDLDLESQTSSRSSSSRNRQKAWYQVSPRVVSDATIGLSDGLTVPFALTAGLSALGSTKVVIYGGLAELIAGAISMGLGGYLGAKSEVDSYAATVEDTRLLCRAGAGQVRERIEDALREYEFPESTMGDITECLAKSPKLLEFLMRFCTDVPEPSSNRALQSAFTIALGYFLGGLLPLLPYFFLSTIREALYVSIGVMGVALAMFGYVKTCVVVGWEGGDKVREGLQGAVQMVVVGGCAAGAAMGLVYAFNAMGGTGV
jgi:VIT1/CCC1 family predicted Fe2+/Mn2+ transporter